MAFSVALLGCELVKPYRLALVLRQTALALLAAAAEVSLCNRVALLGCELVKPHRLALVLRQTASTLIVAKAKHILRT